MPNRIQTGAIEPLLLFSTTSGVNDLAFRIRRFSDGFFFDFSDSTFKTSASVVTINSSALVETDTAFSPGLYELTGGFDFSSITNVSADDTYSVIPVQITGTNAILPTPDELKEGQYVDDIDAAISSRSSHSAANVDTTLSSSHGSDSWETADGFATPGENMNIATSGLNAIADRVWDETLAGHLGAGSTGAALDNAATGGALDENSVASGVWDALRTTHTVAGSFGESTRLTAAGLATDAAQEIRDEILSDSTPFAGANIDTSISSRSSHSATDVDTTLSSSHGAGSWESATGFATHSLNDVVTGVWGQALPDTFAADTAGERLATADDRIDAAITTRSSHTAGDVDTTLSASHGSSNWETATGFATPGENMNIATSGIDAIADQVWDETLSEHQAVGSTGAALNGASTPTIDAGGVASGVWDALRADHTVADSFGESTRLDAAGLATDAAQEIRDEILSDSTPFAGGNIDAAISSRSSHNVGDVASGVWNQSLPDVFGADTAGERLATTDGRVDVTVSTRSSHSAADVDTTLSASHGASNWESATGFSTPGDVMNLSTSGIDAVADQVWEEQISDHDGTGGSTAEALQAADAVADPSAVADAVWNEQTAGHTATGSYGLSVNVTASGLATDAVNEVRDSILSDSTPFPGANVDTAISSRSSHSAADVDTTLSASHGSGSWQTATGFATPEENMNITTSGIDAIADQVWDEVIAGHLAAGSTGAALNDASIDSTLDAGQVASGVWDALRSDHTVADSFGESVRLDAAGLQTDAAQEIRDEILSDSTPFSGANIDAAISSRSSHTAADVDTVLTAAHGAGSWEGEAAAVDAIASGVWEQALPDSFPVGSAGERLSTSDDRIDAAISTRSSHSAADVDTTLSSSHGSSQWETATGFATPGENMNIATSGINAIADQVWDEAIAGHLGAGSTGASLNIAATDSSLDAGSVASGVWDAARTQHTVAGSFGESTRLDAAGLQTDAAQEIRDEILSDSTPFAGANVDAAISSRSSHTAADVDTTLTAAHGAGSWEGQAAEVNAIASGVWNQTLPDTFATGTAGERLATTDDRVDVTLSTRSSHSTADVDTTLSSSHGAGNWEGQAAEVDAIASGVWDELLSNHTASGTAGLALDELAAGSSPVQIADAVWAEQIADHTVSGSFSIELQNKAEPSDVTLYEQEPEF